MRVISIKSTFRQKKTRTPRTVVVLPVCTFHTNRLTGKLGSFQCLSLIQPQGLLNARQKADLHLGMKIFKSISGRGRKRPFFHQIHQLHSAVLLTGYRRSGEGSWKVRMCVFSGRGRAKTIYVKGKEGFTKPFLDQFVQTGC